MSNTIHRERTMLCDYLYYTPHFIVVSVFVIVPFVLSVLFLTGQIHRSNPTWNCSCFGSINELHYNATSQSYQCCSNVGCVSAVNNINSVSSLTWFWFYATMFGLCLPFIISFMIFCGFDFTKAQKICISSMSFGLFCYFLSIFLVGLLNNKLMTKDC